MAHARQKSLCPISGMSVKDFRGFPSIQEVTCWGGFMEAEVKVLSLKLFRVSDSAVMAYVNHLGNECQSFVDYTSCIVDPVDTRKTKLRVLVADLAEEEKREYGCIVTRLKSLDTEKLTWTVTVEGKSELIP